MTRLLSKFFAKKAVILVNDLDLQAQAALQLRVSRIMQHHININDDSVSPQMLRAV